MMYRLVMVPHAVMPLMIVPCMMMPCVIMAGVTMACVAVPGVAFVVAVRVVLHVVAAGHDEDAPVHMHHVDRRSV